MNVSMSLPLNLTGSWIGTFTYGNFYPNAVIGKKIPFRMSIDIHSGGTFAGDCLDLDDLGEHAGASAIKGSLTSSGIQFTKQYGVRRSIDDRGTPYIQPNEAGLRVDYQGTWNETGACFHGIWEIGRPRSLRSRLLRKKREIGTWEMRAEVAKDAQLKAPLLENLTINMLFRREDLEAVYYRDRQSNALKQPIVGRLLYFMGGLFILSASGYLLTWKYGAGGWMVPGNIGLIAFLIAGSLLVKNLYAYFTWKKNVKSEINRLLKDQRHTLRINAKTLTVQAPNELSVEHWEHIHEVNIQDDFMVLSGNQPKYLWIAASMKPEEYQQLKNCVLTYKQRKASANAFSS